MSKVVRLTEKDLTKLVNKVINEQYTNDGGRGFDMANHPFFKQMMLDITGDGNDLIRYVPNKMLETNMYKITKKV